MIRSRKKRIASGIVQFLLTMVFLTGFPGLAAGEPLSGEISTGNLPADVVLEGETVLTIDSTCEISSITGKGETTLIFRGNGSDAVLKISDSEGARVRAEDIRFEEAHILVPEGAQVKEGVITDGEGKIPPEIVIAWSKVHLVSVEDGYAALKGDPGIQRSYVPEGTELLLLHDAGKTPAGKVFAGYAAAGGEEAEKAGAGYPGESCLYTMGKQDVTLTPVYKTPHRITVVGGGARDAVTEADVTEAPAGAELYFWVDYASYPEGKYYAGQKTQPEGLSIRETEGYTFDMPDEDVIITPVYEPQKPGLLDLRDGTCYVGSGEEAHMAHTLYVAGNTREIVYDRTAGTCDLDRDGTIDLRWTDGYYDTLEKTEGGSIPYAVVLAPKCAEYSPLTLLFGNPVVRFDLNGGTGEMEPEEADAEDWTYTLPDCEITPPAGKEFAAWDLGKPGTTITVREDLTLKPVWKAAGKKKKASKTAGAGAEEETSEEEIPEEETPEEETLEEETPEERASEEGTSGEEASEEETPEEGALEEGTSEESTPEGGTSGENPAEEETSGEESDGDENSVALSVTLKSGTYLVTGDTAVFMAPASDAVKTLSVPAEITVEGETRKVAAIHDEACKGMKKLTKVTLGKNVRHVGRSAFEGCTKLKTVSGGKGLVVLSEKAFKGCRLLESFTFHSRVESIGQEAFRNCKKLKKIAIKTKKLKEKNVEENALKGIYSKAEITCPPARLEAYKKLLKKAGAGSKVIYKGDK